MARIRYIKPEFFSDTTIADISIPARYFYIGLFCHMDLNGLVEDDLKLIKRDIFPYDDSLTLAEIEKLVVELCDHKRLFRFSHGGKRFLFCPSFSRHQKFHPGERAKYRIPQKTLLEACQQPASNLPSSTDAIASSIGIGIGTGTGTGIGTGIGTGTGKGTALDPELEEAQRKLLKLRREQDQNPLGRLG